MSRYTSATDADRAAMLERIGVQTIDDLFEAIPEGVRLDRALDLLAHLTTEVADAGPITSESVT